MEGKVFEHAMSGFDLGESEELEVEDTDSLALDERKEIEDGVSEALEENYDTHTAIADCHYNAVRYNGVTTADTSPQGNQISGGEIVGNYRSVVTPIDCPSQKCQAKGKFRHHINNLG